MSEEKKELSLKSIAGAPDVVYPWPLTVGKGNCRGAEDEHDQVRILSSFQFLLNNFFKAVEILDSIRWVCEDQPELKDMMGELLHSYNKTSWESMNKYVYLNIRKVPILLCSDL